MREPGHARRTLLVNVMGGPSCGKAEYARYLARRLESAGLSCAFFSGRAKEMIAKGAGKFLKEARLDTQANILDLQRRAVEKSWGAFDVIVTDCSPIQGVQYCQRKGGSWKKACEMALSDHRRHEERTVNLFIVRGNRPYEQEGRVHSYEEAKAIDEAIAGFMQGHALPFLPLFLEGPTKRAEMDRGLAEVADAIPFETSVLGVGPGPSATARSLRARMRRRGLSDDQAELVAAAAFRGWDADRFAALVETMPRSFRGSDAASKAIRSGAWNEDVAEKWLQNGIDMEAHRKNATSARRSPTSARNGIPSSLRKIPGAARRQSCSTPKEERIAAAKHGKGNKPHRGNQGESPAERTRQ